MFNSMTIRRFQPFRNSVVFARFGNRPTDEDMDGHDGDVRVEFNDGDDSNAGQRAVVQGFRNPLFKADVPRDLVSQPEGDAAAAPTDDATMTEASLTMQQCDPNQSDDDDGESIKLVDVELDTEPITEIGDHI